MAVSKATTSGAATATEETTPAEVAPRAVNLPSRPKNQPIPGANQDNLVQAQDMKGNVLPNPVPRSWLKTFSKTIKAVPSAKEGK